MTVLEALARVSLVVPTRNEADNIGPLVARAQQTLTTLDVPWEIVFVDDSDDNTPEIARQQPAEAPVRVLHRTQLERTDGLSGAVLRGIEVAQGEIVVVMDGDLQHPPEMLDALVAPLLEHRADIVVATRYRGEGRADGLRGWWRRFVSQSALKVVHVALPRTRPISDPLGGFFAFRRDVVDGVELKPVGFKILLEILVRGRWLRATEVPYTFASRTGGTSKASAREGFRFLRHLVRLLPARGTDVVIDLRGDEPSAELAGIGAPANTSPGRVRRLQPRLLAVVLTVAAAFAVSLASLATAVRTSNDLAYLVAAAPLALIVLASRVRPNREEPAIHDREIDALLGALLLAAAALLLLTGTQHAPALFWAHRVDLLAFPIFLAGVVALLLGTRTLWRARAASVFALLTWPPAARVVLAEPISRLTHGTARLIGTLAEHLGLADASNAGRTLTLTNAGHTYVVHLTADARTTATLVAFVLVGTCAVLVRRDPWLRALLFVVAGAATAWVMRVTFTLLALEGGNTGRIEFMRVLLGPWLDALAVSVSLLMMTIALRARISRTLGRDTPWVRASSGRMPRAIAIFASVAIVVAIGADTQIDRNDRLTTALGAPQLIGLSSAPTTPAGASLLSRRTVSPAPATAPADSSWTRLRYESSVDASQSVVDVIDAPTSTSLDDGNLRAWYPIGWRTPADSSGVRLADGVEGRLLTFHGARGVWMAMTWLWPVDINGHARLERVVVMPNAESTDLSALGTGSQWLAPQQVGPVGDSLRALSIQIARVHLAHARVSDGPPVVEG